MPKIELKKKLKQVISLSISMIFGFFCGHFVVTQKQEIIPLIKKEIKPEISLIQIQKIVDDELFFKISGPARILWAKENFVENDGIFSIPLGQIPNKNDLELEKFSFLGNEKTNKFYPSNSYPARGTEVRYRRFFKTKEKAIEAGFVATKLVK